MSAHIRKLHQGKVSCPMKCTTGAHPSAWRKRLLLSAQSVFDSAGRLSAARKPLETTRKFGLRLTRGRRELFVAVGGEDVVCQEAAGLVAPELVVMTAEAQQLGVRAFFDHAASVEHDQPVHARDGGEAVRDGDPRLSFPEGQQLLP